MVWNHKLRKKIWNQRQYLIFRILTFIQKLNIYPIRIYPKTAHLLTQKLNIYPNTEHSSKNSTHIYPKTEHLSENWTLIQKLNIYLKTANLPKNLNIHPKSDHLSKSSTFIQKRNIYPKTAHLTKPNYHFKVKCLPKVSSILPKLTYEATQKSKSKVNWISLDKFARDLWSKLGIIFSLYCAVTVLCKERDSYQQGVMFKNHPMLDLWKEVAFLFAPLHYS